MTRSCPKTEIRDAAWLIRAPAFALSILLGANLSRSDQLWSSSRRKVWESGCVIGAMFLSGCRCMGREKDDWPFWVMQRRAAFCCPGCMGKSMSCHFRILSWQQNAATPCGIRVAGQDSRRSPQRIRVERDVGGVGRDRWVDDHPGVREILDFGCWILNGQRSAKRKRTCGFLWRGLYPTLRRWEGNSIWVFMVVLRSGRNAEI